MTLFYFLCFILIISLLFLSLRGTDFDFDIRKGQVWSILFYKDLILILIPTIFVSYYGVDYFKSSLFYATDDSASDTNLLILYSVIVFVICMSLSLRFFKTNYSQDDFVVIDKNTIYFFKVSLSLGIFILIFSMAFLNYKHAVISSIISGDNLLVARISNKYQTLLPSQLGRLITVSCWMGAILSGIYLYVGNNKKAIFSLILTFFVSSADGGKSPMIITLIIFVATLFMLNSKRIHIAKVLIYVPVCSFILFLSLFYITSLQLSSLDLGTFLKYLINRVGVGQMSGVYETFAIPDLEGSYYLHSVPFASFFFEYPTYDKDLMVFVEDLDPTKTGVKNSFFLSESYGAFGWWGVFLFPFWVGIVYPLNQYIISRFLNVFVGKQVALFFASPFFFMSFSINGGISSLLLFKGLIFNLVLLTFFVMNYYLIKSFSGLLRIK